MGPLCIGIEYIRTNNIQLAEQFINLSMTICPFDPLIYNEIGVISFKNKDYNVSSRNRVSFKEKPVRVIK